MNRGYTTIEQSKHLLELGLDPHTSDMSYRWCFCKCVNGEPAEDWLIEIGKPFDECPDEQIPAWSLSALLDLMPPYLFEWERGIDLNVYRNLKGKGWHVSYMPNNINDMMKDKFRQISNGDTPIDAAFEMVCWLLENEHIKTE